MSTIALVFTPAQQESQQLRELPALWIDGAPVTTDLHEREWRIARHAQTLLDHVGKIERPSLETRADCRRTASALAEYTAEKRDAYVQSRRWQEITAEMQWTDSTPAAPPAPVWNGAIYLLMAFSLVAGIVGLTIALIWPH